MKQDKITITNIKSDLNKIAFFYFDKITEWRLTYIVPITIIALLLGIVFKNVFIGLLIFSVATYHIIQYIIACKRYIVQKKAIRKVTVRSDVCVSIESLTSITNERIYEPYIGFSGRHAYATKEVMFFNFRSFRRWRNISCMHYEWSKEYCMSPKGLDNISIIGNEFFYISLQGYPDISYIYPSKYFILDKSLRDDTGDSIKDKI